MDGFSILLLGFLGKDDDRGCSNDTHDKSTHGVNA